MVWLLVANLVMGLWVLGVSHNQAFHNALHFYPSTLLTIYHAGAAAGIALVGAFVRRAAFVCLMASSIALAALPLSCFVSVAGYPGGDDGGSLGWGFYVGLSSLVALGVGIMTAAAGMVLRGRSKRKHMAGDSPD